MYDIESLYNLGAEEPFENLNLYMMWANFTVTGSWTKKCNI